MKLLLTVVHKPKIIQQNFKFFKKKSLLKDMGCRNVLVLKYRIPSYLYISQLCNQPTLI